ncbi:protein IQ-DOMAIN 1 isoform X2 [Phalaenopsis equestris]|uniref:protein IQ-DOMAIN 1 isoform X2 n=1 Tax=Phalaenopsis equestris TaxID=78828 RepID=UPI0009E38520|nr:protein IQ-DOMAIN 1 isoform X2 [Phalaenopsis equestris]
MVVGSSWIMGSGDWFKTIIGKRKTKQNKPKPIKGSICDQSNGFKLKNLPNKSSNKLYNGSCSRNNIGDSGLNSEIAAIRIQTAFRCYQARKIARQLKGTQRLRSLSDGDFIKRQTSITLRCAQSWSKIQAEIRARRVSMAKEGRIKQKRHENQVKLEAKLHDLEVEWSGGVETMDEILSRIYQREEAAVKRERAMAYAFSHQWRANPGANHWQTYEIGSGNWGWSWMERWITARPWEMRISSLQKTQSKVAVKAIKKGDPSIASAQSSTKPPIPTTKIPAKKFSARLVEEKAANKEQNPAMVTMQTCEVV